MSTSDATCPSAPAVSRWHRIRTSLAIAAGVAGAATAVALRNPNRPGSWLVCPYLATTGFYCPGCGSLRAFYALLHGDISLALAQNPLFVCSVPVLAVWWLLALRRAWLGVPKQWLVSRKLLATLPIFIALYWIARNLPGLTFLGPLPLSP